jgi:hypothetical protein
MKSRRQSLTAIVALVTVAGTLATGCGKSEPKKDFGDSLASAFASSIASSMASAAAQEAANAAASAPAANAVEVSADMRAFMTMLDGTGTGASKALKKYAIKGKENEDLGNYSLREASVSKMEKSGALTCYTMLSKAGMMDHVSRICWNAKGKIAETTDESH